MRPLKLSPTGDVVQWQGPPHYPGGPCWELLVGNGTWLDRQSEFTDAEVADWPNLGVLRRHPPPARRMPPCAFPPQWATESAPVYAARVYRWRVWLLHEPRPDLWFADPDDVVAYQVWRETDPVGRLA